MTITDTSAVARPTSRLRRNVAVAIVIAAAVLGGAAYWYFALQHYHFRSVSDGILYRDGNRGLREFRHALADSRARTVVSLIDDKELADPAKPQFAAEAAYCKQHGIRLVRIPVRLGGWPTGGQINHFLTIVQDPASRPVLVHCAQGVRRTGMFVAAYQLDVQDRSPGNVKAAIQSFGHKPRDTDDVRAFVDRYDVPTGTVMPSATASATAGVE